MNGGTGFLHGQPDPIHQLALRASAAGEDMASVQAKNMSNVENLVTTGFRGHGANMLATVNQNTDHFATTQATNPVSYDVSSALNRVGNRLSEVDMATAQGFAGVDITA